MRKGAVYFALGAAADIERRGQLHADPTAEVDRG